MKIDRSQKPHFVPVKPESGAEPVECFSNVKTKVETDGGEIKFGWAIWEWPNLMIEAEFHAVWISSENDPIDITPKPVGIDSVLFLPDSTRTYDYNRDYYRVDNIRRPLSTDPLISEFIRLSEEIFEYEERHFPGDRIDPQLPAFTGLQVLKEQLAMTYLQLMPQVQPVPDTSKPGRNSPCPCGSGKKFKKCCGKP